MQLGHESLKGLDRDRVIAVLRDGDATEAQLDFSRVGVMDYSCADEVVAKLLIAMLEGNHPRLALRGLSKDHVDAIESALERYQLLARHLLHVNLFRRLVGRGARDPLRYLTGSGRASQ